MALLLGGREGQEIQRGALIDATPMDDMEIAARSPDTLVAHQGLEGREVDPRFD